MAKKQKGPIFFTDKEDPKTFSISNQFAEHLEFTLVKDRYTVTGDDAYYALSLAIRDRLVRRWLRTQRVYQDKGVKTSLLSFFRIFDGKTVG